MKYSNRKDIGRRIAFAGIGAAVSLVFVILSYYVNILTLSFTVFSSCGIMIPLAMYYYKESIFSAVVTIALGAIFANIKILPYVLASGVYVVITTIMHDKKLNIFLSYFIKLVYFCFVFFVLYKLTGLFVINIEKISFLQNLSQAWLYVVLNIFFVICFVIYDILLIEGVKLARYVASKLKLNPVKPNDNNKAKPEIQKEETKIDDENKDFNDIYKM